MAARHPAYPHRVWFVERSRVDSAFSKLVFHLPETTVLGWFQRIWHEEDPDALLTAEIGGGPHGLDSIFEAIEEHHLPRPRTLDELREVLHEHLWIESAHPDRLSFLVNDVWPLPSDVAMPLCPRGDVPSR